MKVGDSIRLAIADFERGESEAAMLHACNAIDGTAKKVYPDIKSVGRRFTKLIRANYDIFGLMAVRGVNVAETRWPVRIQSTLGKNEWPDTADLIYFVHRCVQGHGDELPDGFELGIREAELISEMHVEEGKVRLPWNTIFGLIAVAVVQRVNIGQRVPEGYYLNWGVPQIRFEINEWWGRKDDLRAQLATQHTPLVTMNWGDWTANPPSGPTPNAGYGAGV
ncbi:hypothetical protein [Nocardia sienata]|uniref:hypothetical protein n=1 Tax=Nocardia sienata TaxID=248552 RepID=UPI0012EEC448|nr:hypothetical protein [Nocardia sienata]